VDDNVERRRHVLQIARSSPRRSSCAGFHSPRRATPRGTARTRTVSRAGPQEAAAGSCAASAASASRHPTPGAPRPCGSVRGPGPHGSGCAGPSFRPGRVAPSATRGSMAPPDPGRTATPRASRWRTFCPKSTTQLEPGVSPSPPVPGGDTMRYGIARALGGDAGAGSFGFRVRHACRMHGLW
jgi:hypothetical protein